MVIAPFLCKPEGLTQSGIAFPFGKKILYFRHFEKVLKNCAGHLVLRDLVLDAQVKEHCLQPNQVLTGNNRVAPKGAKPANKLKPCD